MHIERLWSDTLEIELPEINTNLIEVNYEIDEEYDELDDFELDDFIFDDDGFGIKID